MASKRICSPAWSVPRQLAPGLAIAALVPIAVITGIAGVFLHRAAIHVGSVRIPYGLVLALFSTVVLAVLVRAVTPRRLGAGLALVAWLLAVIPFTAKRPEGDLLIASGAAGLVFLFGGVIVMSISFGLPTSTNRNRELGQRVH